MRYVRKRREGQPYLVVLSTSHHLSYPHDIVPSYHQNRHCAAADGHAHDATNATTWTKPSSTPRMVFPSNKSYI